MKSQIILKACRKYDNVEDMKKTWMDGPLKRKGLAENQKHQMIQAFNDNVEDFHTTYSGFTYMWVIPALWSDHMINYFIGTKTNKVNSWKATL